MQQKSSNLSNEDIGALHSWFIFSEVKQTWLGYSLKGNKGRGLGPKFAKSLNLNLKKTFVNFGSETITKGSHLERLCLLEDGVGKDNISDFTTVLIKHYLAKFTQEFARKHINPALCKVHSVSRAYFNYETETWASRNYLLPTYEADYVLLAPKDLLTKEDLWIYRKDMLKTLGTYPEINIAISNPELRHKVNNYFQKILEVNSRSKKKPKKEEINEAIDRVITEFPEVIDYYILHKESTGDIATAQSIKYVEETELLFYQQVIKFVESILVNTQFYKIKINSYQDSYLLANIFKESIESNSAQWIFYSNGTPISNEEETTRLFNLIWRAESKLGKATGSFLPEIKLAKNPQIHKRLEKIKEHQTKYKNSLLEWLDKRLDMEETKTLCFKLGEDYDNLSGEGKIGKIRELINLYTRKNKLFELGKNIKEIY